MEHPDTNSSRLHSNLLDGKGCIIIGTAWKDPAWVLEQIAHELMEAVLVEGADSSYEHVSGDVSRRIFIFNHDRFTSMARDMLGALISSGLITVPRAVSFKRKATEEEINDIMESFDNIDP
jgi:hypothetical protein